MSGRVISGFFGGSSQQLFEQKSGSEPAGREIQTDQMPYIPTAPAIVPGTEPLLFQKASGKVFRREDQSHISKAADPEGAFSQQPADGREDGRAAVDWEHPEGSGSFKRHIAAAEGTQGCEQDFHAPARKTAFYEIVKKGKQGFFHRISHSAVSAAPGLIPRNLPRESLLFTWGGMADRLSMFPLPDFYDKYT